MARQVQGSDQLISSKQDIIAFLTAELKAKTTQKLGVEWEMFPYTKSGDIPSLKQINTLFENFAEEAKRAGHEVSVATENGMMIAVDLKNVGNLCIEPGGQVEFATALCNTKADVLNALQTYLSLAKKACGDELVLKGQGQDIKFRDAPLVPRSRFINYARYIKTFSEDIVGCIKSACSFQVNVDVDYNTFVETFKALIVAESILALENNKTSRLSDWFNAFSQGMGNQSRPFFEMFDVQTTDQALDIVASRLLTIRTPILPDPKNAEGYLFHNEFGYKEAPTIADLMEKKMLSEKVLKNMLGLMMMFPAYRRPSSAEVRGMDSPETLEKAMAMTSIVEQISYNPSVRKMFASAISNASEAEKLFGAVTHTKGQQIYRDMMKENPTLAQCATYVRSALKPKIRREKQPVPKVA